jgi:hypothetical protein
VDHRAGLEDMEKSKFLTLPGLVLPPFSVPIYTYTDYVTPNLWLMYKTIIYPLLCTDRHKTWVSCSIGKREQIAEEYGLKTGRTRKIGKAE